MTGYACHAVERAVATFAQGGMVLILDGADRENEGDLAVAAEFATPEAIAFMLLCARGLVCLPVTGERLDQLGLPPMVPDPEPGSPAFTVSVDARGVGSGISARDRAATVRALIDPATRPGDLVRPGHLFPLRCAPGGLAQRRGHTEASVELALRAGLYPAAVICEVLNAAGDAARPAEARHFARCHGIPVVTIAELVAARPAPALVRGRAVARAGLPAAG